MSSLGKAGRPLAVVLVALVSCSSVSGEGAIATGVTEPAATEEEPDAPASVCLDLGADAVEFGEVSDDDWREWTGISIDFASDEQHLEVQQSSDGASLRQQFVPSSEGSDRVVVRGDLRPARTYTMSQEVFLEPDFDWGRERQTGKLGFGLGGGTAPSGGDLDPAGYTARFVWRGNGDGTARAAVYSYAADRTQNLPFGDDYTLADFSIPIGRWFTLEMEVTANTEVGLADGRIRAWADGQLALERDGILWQDAGGQPIVDHFIYSTFHGGNGWEYAPEATSHARFRNVCWSAITAE